MTRWPAALSRREFVRNCALGAAAVAAAPVGRSGDRASADPADGVLPLDSEWLFGGSLTPGALAPEFDDSRFDRITLPHCVARLSWRNWPCEE